MPIPNRFKSPIVTIPLGIVVGALLMGFTLTSVEYLKACRVALAAPPATRDARGPGNPRDFARPADDPAPPTGPMAAFPGIKQTPGAGIALGNGDAPHVLYVFSDFECPFCGRFEATIAQEIRQQFVDPGKLRLVYIDLPLPGHRLARPAANAARCANDQHRFWQYHDALFRRQAEWAQAQDPSATFTAIANSLGLDRTAFTACISKETHGRDLDAGMKFADAMEVRGTPFLYLDGAFVPANEAVSHLTAIAR